MVVRMGIPVLQLVCSLADATGWGFLLGINISGWNFLSRLGGDRDWLLRPSHPGPVRTPTYVGGQPMRFIRARLRWGGTPLSSVLERNKASPPAPLPP